MKFGKLPDITGLDFALPADPPGNQLRLGEHNPTNNSLSAYIGCTGWGMPPWVGKWYPKGTKSQEFLAAYGQQFNTIELNTTHYRTPDVLQVEKWCDQVPEDFRFCPKVLQRISHDRNLGFGGDQLPLFWDAMAAFGDRMGCCFVQLPPYFGLDRLALLKRFLQAWPQEIPLAVEVRHESWFSSPEATEQLAELLFEQQKAAVITDVAGRRDVLHMLLTSAVSMVRFVGNGLHPTDYERADDWCRRIAEWQENGLQELYFFPHQPDNVEAPEMARYIVDKLQGIDQINVRGPHPIENKDDAGQQMALF